MRQINVNELDTSRLFSKIGEQWMLIGAADGNGKTNFMTASWGGLGVLWNENVATCYIRPTRYTMNFTERSEYFTLSFYPPDKRQALTVMGRKSGRDCDKLALAGMTQAKLTDAVYCEGAHTVILCKKLYAQDMDADCFTDKSILDKHYPARDLHRMYVGKIEKIFLF